MCGDVAAMNVAYACGELAPAIAGSRVVETKKADSFTSGRMQSYREV
jgi:hypothetical protein